MSQICTAFNYSNLVQYVIDNGGLIQSAQQEGTEPQAAGPFPPVTTACFYGLWGLFAPAWATYGAHPGSVSLENRSLQHIPLLHAPEHPCAPGISLGMYLWGIGNTMGIAVIAEHFVFVYVNNHGVSRGSSRTCSLNFGFRTNRVFWVLKCSWHKLSAFGCYNNLFSCP